MIFAYPSLIVFKSIYSFPFSCIFFILIYNGLFEKFGWWCQTDKARGVILPFEIQ